MYIVFPENIYLFPLISWFVLYLILQAFTHQNATVCIKTCSVKNHGAFPFQNLQVKTFETSFYFSHVWFQMMKRVLLTSPSTFDHFACHCQGLCWVVCCSEFYIFFSILHHLELDIRKITRWLGHLHLKILKKETILGL